MECRYQAFHETVRRCSAHMEPVGAQSRTITTFAGSPITMHSNPPWPMPCARRTGAFLLDGILVKECWISR